MPHQLVTAISLETETPPSPHINPPTHQPTTHNTSHPSYSPLRTTTRTPQICTNDNPHFPSLSLFSPLLNLITMSSIVSKLAIKLHAEKKSIVGSLNLRTNFHLSR
jgi:hypothetical protein